MYDFQLFHRTMNDVVFRRLGHPKSRSCIFGLAELHHHGRHDGELSSHAGHHYCTDTHEQWFFHGTIMKTHYIARESQAQEIY